MSIQGAQQPEHSYEFDVAFSFAEENWRFVDRVAGYLKQKQIRVYYYKDREHDADAWGEDLFHHLQRIYRDKARFCVMFISRPYKDKHWTSLEQEWAKERARKLIREKSEQKYILPFKFDDTEIEGLEKLRYLSINQYNEKQLANIIEQKLRPKSGSERTLRQRAVRLLAPMLKPAALVIALLGAVGWFIKSQTAPEVPANIQVAPLYDQHRLSEGGAVCRDGTLSSSRGPGTCSHHGGIDHYIDSATYRKLKESQEQERRTEQERIYQSD